MKLSEVKESLKGLDKISFKLPNGDYVPDIFHVSEIGKISRNFIDCGGTIRTDHKINFQLWEDETDIDHKLKPTKLNDIIELSERALALNDMEIEVEYQGKTKEIYALDFDGKQFLLINTSTACLAQPDKSNSGSCCG